MVKPLPHTRAGLLDLLEAVPDPEIPVLNIVEMGIVRDVSLTAEGALQVDITPTYSGCPAMREIENTIVAEMQKQGFANVAVRTVFAEPWTTDWMTEAAKEKLRAYGIAPPEKRAAESWQPFSSDRKAPVPCPFCGSSETRLTSPFGSTACKALHYCDGCDQPFEHFKCI